MVIIILLSLSCLNAMFLLATISAHRLRCDKLWPLITPLQPVNSTGGVLLLEEHEMAKQVYMGWPGVYARMGVGWEWVHSYTYAWVYSTRWMCVYLQKSAMSC